MKVPSSSSETEQFERIRTEVFETPDAAVGQVAQRLAELIRSRSATGRRVVLGLATGSTPVKLYRELVRLHQEEALSFRNVVTFNLDEYYGLSPEHPESYHRFMHDQLFRWIDLPPENTHVPDGMVPRAGVFAYCADYERQIAEAGGLDLQILGIGRTGHIGFNEPGSAPDSRTRMVALDRLTRRDAARDFRGEANVPAYAITMGVGTILEAREIILLAWGEAKASVLRDAIEGPAAAAVPASFLQHHPNARCYLDRTAAGELTRFRYPWKVGSVRWDEPLTRRAVVWLANELRKPVLRLRDEDYSENGLSPLLVETGSAYGLNIRVFNRLQHTITGWPGGKPNADDSHRPVPAEPARKRVLVLSPEPLDAELGMAGTLNRLVAQGHEVSLVHLTSGNLGVPDGEAKLAVNLLKAAAQQGGTADAGQTGWPHELEQELESKSPLDEDSGGLRRFKGLIRQAEARAAARVLEIAASATIHLNLAFYERGRYRQFRTTEDDADRVATLFRQLQPHQVYLTGARSEPNSVAGIAFQLFRNVWVRSRTEPWAQSCQVWLYAAGERAWSPAEIEMAVPLSPAELLVKLDALCQYRSQRNQTPFFRDMGGELWQLAEDANRSTAQAYDRLGLAEYEAMETFRRWKGEE
jgi:glucosamine-6-phosphate deaminase